MGTKIGSTSISWPSKDYLVFAKEVNGKIHVFKTKRNKLGRTKHKQSSTKLGSTSYSWPRGYIVYCKKSNNKVAVYKAKMNRSGRKKGSRKRKK